MIFLFPGTKPFFLLNWFNKLFNKTKLYFLHPHFHEEGNSWLNIHVLDFIFIFQYFNRFFLFVFSPLGNFFREVTEFLKWFSIFTHHILKIPNFSENPLWSLRPRFIRKLNFHKLCVTTMWRGFEESRCRWVIKVRSLNFCFIFWK